MNSSTLSNRIASIDILRALTMILMIFVNDLWSLKDIPAWLEHVGQGVDGIGLADVVFPAFLFIVGLSIPFSMDSRRSKGDTDWQLLNHVLLRTLALLTLGVFLVNGEEINEVATGLPRHWYNTLCCISFILIWNAYSKTANKNWILVAKGAGILILLALAFIYRSGETGIDHFSPKWWGILGLIGWAYGASGVAGVFSKNNFTAILLLWLFFCGLSIASHAGLLNKAFFLFIPNPILGGTLVALTMGGVVTSMIFRHYVNRHEPYRLMLALFLFSVLLILLSMAVRPYWGLSKLGATPAWLFLCSAFTILTFIAIYWLADLKGKANWFAKIEPAGTDTLLCYLIPYFSYAFVSVSGIRWPELMLTGSTGLLKSFLFALLCVWIVAGLNKINIKLKL